MTPGTWLVFMGARFMALGLPQFYEIRFWDETSGIIDFSQATSFI
jgi:hypothetical protein